VVNFNEVAGAVHRLVNGKQEGEGTLSSEFFVRAPDDAYYFCNVSSYGTAVDSMYTLVLYNPYTEMES
jgi:hypothetical protein